MLAWHVGMLVLSVVSCHAVFELTNWVPVGWLPQNDDDDKKQEKDK
jgi:hypothetical protein